jgi:stage II sporulation protein D
MVGAGSLKRWLAGAIVVLYFAVLLVPFWTPFRGAPPHPAPERQEPVIPFVESRTGRRIGIPMEEYLAGVVAAEMDGGFPDQALAAQAIIARTYTLRRIEQGDVATDDVRTFQAYDPAKITPALRAAVAPARGQVIVYGGDLVDAVYHACAGGRTAGAAEGMLAPERPYLQPVDDPPCQRDETWSVRLPAAELARAAGVAGAVWSVALGKRGPSGRALTLLVNGKAASALAIRAGLGGTRMKSTYLSDFRLEGGQVVISGRGYGHGVGLSQWGAAALAGQGLTAGEIIGHYYTGVEIEQRW